MAPSSPASLARHAACLAPALALLAGCMPGEASIRAARGEPAGGATLILATHGDHYEIHRWHETESFGEPLAVPRAAAPGCDAIRFVLDDAGTELPVAEPRDPPFVTADRVPLPAPGSAACTLRLAYGRFGAPPGAAGVFVTGPAGIVAESRLAAARPGYYALTPFEAFGEVWLFSAAALASPVLLPGAVAWEHVDGDKARAARASAEAALPAGVAACWRAADAAAGADSSSNPGRRFRAFAWPATGAGAYGARDGTPGFADGLPACADRQVTLRLGRARVGERLLWTDAEIDCALAGDAVVATRFRLVP